MRVTSRRSWIRRFIRLAARSIASTGLRDPRVLTTAPEKCRRRDNGSERISEIVRHDAEDLVSRADGRLRDVVEESVVQRERRASSELLRHAHVLGPIPMPRATPHGGQHRYESIARDDRNEHDGLDADRFE